MFSLNQSDELVFQINPFPQQPQQQQDLALVDHDSSDGCLEKIVNNTKKNPKKKSLNRGHNNDESGNSDKEKKVMHREIERLRRQEMAKLYESLRSLLPLEFIRGKRSISDHMHQAANYINHLQGSIKELENKKNKLKKMCDNSARIGGPGSGISSNHCLPNNNIVKVNPCLCGVEILMMEEGNIPLSRVMEVLLEEGLNVISCASTKVNDRLLHIIKSEASDPSCIDISALQQKLDEAICF